MTTVAIEIHGSVSNGLWSPERGESRWAQNVAAVLASEGHRIIAFGSWSPGAEPWGTCPRIPGVEIVPWPAMRGVDVDIAFDAAAWDGKPQVVRPRVLLRGYFSYGTGVIDKPWPARDRLVYPYSRLASEMAQAPRESRLLAFPFLGLDFWSRFLPRPLPDAPRDGVLWCGKTPFGSQGADSTTAQWSDAQMATTERLCASGLRALFIGHEWLRDRPESRAFRAWERAAAIDRADLLPILPLGDMLLTMRRSLVCMNQPHDVGYPLECVLEGCVPLVWRGVLPELERAAQAVAPWVVLDPDRPDPAMLDRVVDVLLSDDALRASLLGEMRRNVVAEYGAKRTVETWREVLRWVGA